MPENFISREDAESDLLSAAAFIAENIKSADGRAEAMNAIVPLYLAKGNVDLAAELANEVVEPFSRDRLLTLVAEKCAEVDDDEYALQLADAVEDFGMRSKAFEHVALIKARKTQFEAARTIGERMDHPDFVLAGIAVNQTANGDDNGASATLDEIEYPTARASALLQMATAKIEIGDAKTAISYLEQAMIDADEIEHDEEKIRTLCEIGTHFIDAKRNDKAIETFDKAKGFAEMLENVHRDNLLVNAALGFLYAGSDELADRTLDLVTDKTQMASALLGFSREYWKRDAKGDALDALDEGYEILKSQRDIETRDSRARNSLMTTIAVQFAGYDKADKAVEIAHKNQDPAEEMSGLSQIAQILTMQGKDDQARETIGEIAEESNKVFVYISIADVKEKVGEADDVQAILDEAAELVGEVPQLASRSSALNDLIHRYTTHGQTEKARELTAVNFAVIDEIKDESSKAVALSQLASIYDEANLTLSESEIEHLRRMVAQIGY